MSGYAAPLPAPLYGAQYGRPVGGTGTQIGFSNAMVPTSTMQAPNQTLIPQKNNFHNSERQRGGGGSSQEPPDPDPD